MNYGCVEDVSQGNPVEETQQGFQRRLDQARLVGAIQDLDTELEDGGEFGAHAGL